MAIRFISSAWGAYRKNFLAIISANIILLAVVLAIFFAGLMPLISSGMAAYAEGKIVPTQLFALTGSVLFFLGAIVVASVAALVLRTGIIGIYADALKGRKAEMETMFSLAKEKFWTAIGSSAIVCTIVIAIGLALIVPTAIILAGNIAAATLALLVEVIALVLFALLFSLRSPAIVVGNLNAVDSVKSSYAIVKANYLEFLSLTLILVVISIIVSVLPVLGVILSIFLVQPLMDASYTAFYMEKAGRPAKKVAAAKKKGR